MSARAEVDDFAGRATLHRLGGEDGLPNLLLIHGFGSDRYSWSATAPSFFKTHAVWAVELPGHTDEPIAVGIGDPKSMASAVAMVSRGKLDAPFLVVGHSLGGAVAIELANDYPEMISGVVAIAPAGLGAPTNSNFLVAFPALENAEEAQRLLDSLVSSPRLISPQMVQHVLKFLRQPGRREALIRIATHLDSMQPLITPSAKPVVAIWGDGDIINPQPAAAADRLGCQVHVLGGVGHLPHVEQARKTNSVIAEFILETSVNGTA